MLFSPVFVVSNPRLLSLPAPSPRSQSRLVPFLRALALPHAPLPLCAHTLAPTNPVQSCIYFTTPCIPGGVSPPTAFSRHSPLAAHHSPLSPLESALPRPLTCNPCR